MGERRESKMILWVLAWATGNRELPFTLLGNTAAGISLILNISR